MGDFIKFLPLIWRIIDLIPRIKEAMTAGTSVFVVLQKFAPDILSIVKDVGGGLFPELPVAAQVEAGALIAFNPDEVRWAQDAMNKLGAQPQLVVDGQYGRMTKAAILAFQVKHGLEADGWIGKVTKPVVQMELNKLPVPATPATV